MVDRLPEDVVAAAAAYLERLETDPVLRSLELAGFDDEPLSDEALAGVEEGLADLSAGRTTRLEDLKRELRRA